MLVALNGELKLSGSFIPEKGNTVGAEKAIVEMLDTWPDFPARSVVERFFVKDRETRSRVLSVLDLYSPS